MSSHSHSPAAGHRGRTALLSCVAAATVAAAIPGLAPAPAAAVNKTPVSISMGDSFISGEGGRWNGNSIDGSGSRSGTDRAAVSHWYGYTYDPKIVYGSSYDNGCNRSDVAEIHSVSGTTNLNIACSGAETINIWRARSGGQPFKGEPPQADQLDRIARDPNNKVRLIVLSIGGNDFEFSGIVKRCIAAFEGGVECHDSEERSFQEKRPRVKANIIKAIQEIVDTMQGAGYDRGDYRLIVQSYPSPMPAGDDNRYPALGQSRLVIGGCPFGNSDSNWARRWLTNKLTKVMQQAADDRNTEFLDLSDAFDDREVCSKSTRQATFANPPSPTTSEWIRFLTTGLTQGQLQESIHPNAYGQAALGDCLSLQANRDRGNYRCLNDGSPTAMRLVRL